jgi:hypothetical protein
MKITKETGKEMTAAKREIEGHQRTTDDCQGDQVMEKQISGATVMSRRYRYLIGLAGF